MNTSSPHRQDSLKQNPASLMDEHYQYTLLRLLDCCLREDIRGLISCSQVQPASMLPSDMTMLHTDLNASTTWLRLVISVANELWLPVKPGRYMQRWQAAAPFWIVKQAQSWIMENSAIQWLALLSQGMNEAQRQYYQQYLSEFDCAVEQRKWAKQQPVDSLDDLTRGWPAMRQLEQLAAHQDHPFYPTARAKVGLSTDDLQAYAPETMSEFELNWLAVPRQMVSGDLLNNTPSFAEVGLPAAMTDTHQLVPVHPLTASTYWPQKMAELSQQISRQMTDQGPTSTKKIMIAPGTFLRVRPTLSVRTVSLVETPQIHIKLPLLMRSLGHRNLRTIDPKTLVDGFIFQTILEDIEATDPLLTESYHHCDEKLGGSVNQRSDLSWIIRRYPPLLQTSTVSCVAAFLATDRQGKHVIQKLAEQYYHNQLEQLLTDYIRLQLKTHLTLWLKHGIALESNQQNCMICFNHDQPLKILFRDNDSGRMLPSRYLKQHPDQTSLVNGFRDPRIFVTDDQALMQMFTTITLQLNITAIIDGLADAKLLDAGTWYRQIGSMLVQQLDNLDGQGIDTFFARQALFNEPQHFVKYLLLSGSLLSKEDSGATDINKYYGLSSPNPWAKLYGKLP